MLEYAKHPMENTRIRQHAAIGISGNFLTIYMHGTLALIRIGNPTI